VSDDHPSHEANRPRDRVRLLHRVEVDVPITMGRVRVGVNLVIRRQGAVQPVVVEVRLQGNVVLDVVVTPVRQHRGGRIRHHRDLPHRIPVGRVVPRRHDSLKLGVLNRHGKARVKLGVLNRHGKARVKLGGCETEPNDAMNNDTVLYQSMTLSNQSSWGSTENHFRTSNVNI
jgi:hypothetical protein